MSVDCQLEPHGFTLISGICEIGGCSGLRLDGGNALRYFDGSLFPHIYLSIDTPPRLTVFEWFNGNNSRGIRNMINHILPCALNLSFH